jgi:hypothetical protein
VTLSYQPASAADEATISAYGGFLYDVPAYLLQVRPTLRLDGTAMLSGAPILLGTEHDVVVELLPPGGPPLSVGKHVTAGAYYAVPVAFSRTLAHEPGAKNGRLATTLETGDPALVGHDELIGEHLAALADMYFLIDTRAKAAAGELYRVVQWRQPAIATCAFSVATSEMFGIPSTVRPAGMEFDVRINPMIAVSRTGDATRVRQFMDLTGLAGSFWEHGLFESIHGFPSVSAVKALQAARGAGSTPTVSHGRNGVAYLPSGEVLVLYQVSEFKKPPRRGCLIYTRDGTFVRDVPGPHFERFVGVDRLGQVYTVNGVFRTVRLVTPDGHLKEDVALPPAPALRELIADQSGVKHILKVDADGGLYQLLGLEKKGLLFRRLRRP